MTEKNPTKTESLAALADSVIAVDKPGALDWARGTIYAALNDAYELGAMSVPEPPASTATPAEQLTAFGQALDQTKRAGFVAQVVHTIDPEKIAEHGEDVLLAWIRQTLRELAQGGADPMKDATVQIVGMEDGTVVVTGEGLV